MVPNSTDRREQTGSDPRIVRFDSVRLRHDERLLADAQMQQAEVVAGLIMRAWRAIAR